MAYPWFSIIAQILIAVLAIIAVGASLAVWRTRSLAAPAIPNHSNRMVVNEAAMATGVALHAAVALRFLDGKRGARPA